MATYAVTGGSGSFGSAVIPVLLKAGHKVRALARGEHNLQKLETSITDLKLRKNLSVFVRDVRDRYSLHRAFDGVDIVIHAAALKIIPRCEYDPIEAVKTNVDGSIAVMDACLDCNVQRAILVSTDKASSPLTLYGATKAVAERVWLNGNRYRGDKGGIFVASRWGNVFASQGSVIPLWKKQLAEDGVIKLTHHAMTRFHLRMERALEFVIDTLDHAQPGEIWIPKIPSYRLIDFAAAFNESAPRQFIGIRGVEKIHETMISKDEAPYSREEKKHYVLTPSTIQSEDGKAYDSGSNNWKLSIQELREEIKWLEST